MANTQTSTASNLQGPNLNTSPADGSTYFNNLHSIAFNISAMDNDAIVAFFEQYADNKTAGQNLAAIVTYTALAQGLNPMTVLQQFQNLEKNQLTNYLTAFLNATRISTSVLAVKGSTTTSPFVSRIILI